MNVPFPRRSPEDQPAGKHRAESCDQPPRLGWGHACAFIATVAIIWSVALLVGPLTEANAAGSPAELTAVSSQETWQQPYGGCKEGWQAPRSAGAAECRAHGWVIRPGLAVDAHGRVRHSHLPRCRQEDGSGQRHACSWNFTPGDGNSVGLVYWLDRKDRTHYVWPNRIDWSAGWQWVHSGLADALAEGDTKGATTRDWSRCLTLDGVTDRLVVCPDGERVVI